MEVRAMDGADRLRQSDKIVAAVTEKLEAHSREIGTASQVHITCLIRVGKVEVKLQTTYH